MDVSISSWEIISPAFFVIMAFLNERVDRDFYDGWVAGCVDTVLAASSETVIRDAGIPTLWPPGKAFVSISSSCPGLAESFMLLQHDVAAPLCRSADITHFRPNRFVLIRSLRDEQ